VNKVYASRAIGSCASWGGIPSADPNPTGTVGVDSVISGKSIVNLPGCPPNPYNLLAVVLEYVTMAGCWSWISSTGRSSLMTASSTRTARGERTLMRDDLRPPSATRDIARAGACTSWAARGR